MENAIEFRHISKHFPGIDALKDVSFSVQNGEVHALLGENGAGKTTLLNILHGVVRDYDGEIILNGQRVAFKNPHDAIIYGKISKVHQEINIIRDLSVGQNITLGYEMTRAGIFVDRKEVNKTVNEILEKLNCDFSAEDSASALTSGQMQMMEIAKALFHNSKIISMDEPTSSLTDKETAALFKIIEELRQNSVTIIYVSHRLDEISRICDRATILRDGEYIGTVNVTSTGKDDIIKMMVGRNVNVVPEYTLHSRDQIVLEVKNLQRKPVFSDISFDLKKGEILGFFGLVGAGRTEVMRTLFGADKKTAGTITLNGKTARIRNTQDALKLRIGFLPEERKSQGYITSATNADNVAISSLQKLLSFGLVDVKKKNSNYTQIAAKLNINPRNPDFLTQNMSGGNQQKVILARWLSADVDIFIFDEPTKGIDIGAKQEIYKLMDSLVNTGKSIIVISSELPEITRISDRIIIFYEGRKITELNRSQFNDQVILNYAIGGLAE
jgi:ribose transport system ATP-binding protein